MVRIYERCSPFPILRRQHHVFVERRQLVVFHVRRHRLEVLLEATLGGRPIRRGIRQGHRLFLAVFVNVLQLVLRPRVFQRRVALEIETLRKRRPGVGIEHQQRETATLQCGLRGPHGGLIGDPVLRRARTVQQEDRRPPHLQPSQDTAQQMRRRRLRRLQHKYPPVRHGNERQLLAGLFLPVLIAAVRGHIRHLADEAAGARLPAGVGVNLRVQNDHPDRLARRHEPREVLEPYVEHGAVTTHCEQWGTHRELFVAKLPPVELRKDRLVNLGIVRALELQLRATDRNEAVAHLPHVALEDADRD